MHYDCAEISRKTLDCFREKIRTQRMLNTEKNENAMYEQVHAYASGLMWVLEQVVVSSHSHHDHRRSLAADSWGDWYGYVSAACFDVASPIFPPSGSSNPLRCSIEEQRENH